MDAKSLNRTAGFFCVLAAEPGLLEEEEAPVTQRSPISQVPESGERPVDVRVMSHKKGEPVEFETTVDLDDGTRRDVWVSANLVAENVVIYDAETGEDVTNMVTSDNFDDGFVMLLSYYALR